MAERYTLHRLKYEGRAFQAGLEKEIYFRRDAMKVLRYGVLLITALLILSCSLGPSGYINTQEAMSDNTKLNTTQQRVLNSVFKWGNTISIRSVDHKANQKYGLIYTRLKKMPEASIYYKIPGDGTVIVIMLMGDNLLEDIRRY